MRRSTSLMVMSCLVGFVLGAAMLAGCSDSERRGESRTLLESVDQAQRRFDTALSMLQSPHYKDASGAVWPARQRAKLPARELLSGVREPTRDGTLPSGSLNPAETKLRQAIKLQSPEAVNPRIESILAEAHKELDAALEACPRADASVQGLAKATLARIESLQGAYHGRLAAAAESAAYAYAVGIEEKIGELVAQAYQQKTYAAAADQTIDALVAQVAAADGMVGKIEAQKSTLQGRTTALETHNVTLTGANNDLARERRKLIAGLRDASGEKAEALRLKVLAKSERADKNFAKMQANESNLALTKIEIEDLALAIGAATDLKASLGKVLASRRGDAAKLDEARAALRGRRASTWKALETEATRASAAMTTFTDERAKARKSLDLAVGHFGSAAKPQPGAKARRGADRVALLDGQGGEYMAMADLIVRGVALDRRIAGLVVKLRKHWQEQIEADRDSAGHPQALVELSLALIDADRKAELKAKFDEAAGKFQAGGGITPDYRQAMDAAEAARKDAYDAADEAARLEAGSKYKNAADGYKRAVGAAGGMNRWEYQLLEADAYIGQWRVVVEEEDRQTARVAAEKLIAEATRDPETAGSPYVAPKVARMRQMLGQ